MVIIVVCLLFYNLFVGVVIETYMIENRILSKNHLLTKSQKVWLHIQIMTLNASPKKALDQLGYGKCRLRFVRFVKNPNFDRFILFAIMLNTLILTLNWYMQPETYEKPFEIINMVFMATFTVEAAIKIYALRKDYFREAWNVFDFFIVILTLIILIFQQTGILGNVGAITTILRTLRICRVFRIVKRLKKL